MFIVLSGKYSNYVVASAASGTEHKMKWKLNVYGDGMKYVCTKIYMGENKMQFNWEILVIYVFMYLYGVY